MKFNMVINLVKGIIIFVICVVCISPSPGNASAPQSVGAIIIVNTLEDHYDEPADGDCSLREAVNAANTDAAYGGCDAGSGSDSIILPDLGGSYLLTRSSGVVDGAYGDLDITSNITIWGENQGTTVIDAAGVGDRIIEVAASSRLELDYLTLTHGTARDGEHGAAGISGLDGQAGGAIISIGSPIVLHNVTLSENSAGNGGYGGDGNSGENGGDGGAGAPGGAIAIYNSTLIASYCLFNSNHAGGGNSGGNGGYGIASGDPGSNGGEGGTGGSGGAIYIDGGSLELSEVTFSDNSAGNAGDGGDGGIGVGSFATGGAGGSGGLSNPAGEGGAVYSYDAFVVIADSTFTTNSGGASGSGGSGGVGGNGWNGSQGSNPYGGIGGQGGSGGQSQAGGNGGAISAHGGDIAITASQFFSNSGGDGGLSGDGGDGGHGGRGADGESSEPFNDGYYGGEGGNGGNGPTSQRGGHGGAIYLYHGVLTIDRSTFAHNTTGNGGTGGAGGAGGYGGDGGNSGDAGGVPGYGVDGGYGGNGGSATGSGFGGAVFLSTEEQVIITNVTFSSNHTGEPASGGEGGAGGDGGDAGYYWPDPMNLYISGAGGDGGDGGNGGNSGAGGAVYVGSLTTGDVRLRFVTILLNSAGQATGFGGNGGNGGAGGMGENQPVDGVDGADGWASSRGFGGGLYNSHFNTTTLAGVIIAQNNTRQGIDCFGDLVSGGGNIIGISEDCTLNWQADDLHDLTASPLNLGPLALNGDEPRTHAVLFGSVALDHIQAGKTGCGSEIISDARGYPRPQGGFCEVGAFEVQLDHYYLPMLLK
jgi:CSLREA domain-containing protein